MNRVSDLISRQAAIDAVQKELTEWEHSHVFNIWTTAEVRFLVAEVILKKIPTAEPKTGRWMFPDPPIHKPICSECGKPCIGLHAFEYVLTDYCPNCGAKMEGEKNE